MQSSTLSRRARSGLSRDDRGLLRLRVLDDGSGCPDDVPPGLGTRLISRLVKEHKGSYSRINREKVCEVVVTLAPATRFAR
jgi:two-component sensor histidine kinase